MKTITVSLKNYIALCAIQMEYINNNINIIYNRPYISTEAYKILF